MSIITRTRSKSSRRPFGQGLGERHPVYRAPVPISDLCWYEEQLAMEEERELARRFAAYEAQNRMDAGLEPW